MRCVFLLLFYLFFSTLYATRDFAFSDVYTHIHTAPHYKSSNNRNTYMQKAKKKTKKTVLFKNTHTTSNIFSIVKYNIIYFKFATIYKSEQLKIV
jgi:hypothetical protein